MLCSFHDPCIDPGKNMYTAARPFIHSSTVALLIPEVLHVSRNVQIQQFKTGRRPTEMVFELMMCLFKGT